eukprot:TRINITY_DN1719_c0_g1_i17.p1 TRINITY_DN1719_c0_g1~~TRINITY_DN1719_c0_g1_i17.p1  ORF type:complete len:147 (+),score=9.07 TRINITY_DN1719_c0_g1_i17:150-590(+)
MCIRDSCIRDQSLSHTGLSPAMAALSRAFCQQLILQLFVPSETDTLQIPRPLPCNAFGLSHMTGLGYFPFARRYLGNRFYFLFLGVLRCFSSPRWPDQAMYSPEHVTPVSYTHLTLPTILLVQISVVAVSLKKKKKYNKKTYVTQV